MINKFRNYLFLSLGALALGAFLFTFKCLFYSSNEPHQANVATDDTAQKLCPEQFLKHVDTLMTNTWDQFKNTSNVTMQDCHHFLKEHGNTIKENAEKARATKAKMCKPLQQDTISLVQGILKDFNIQPNNIKIVPYNGKGSPAAADDYTMYIDEELLGTFSPQAQQFIIAHEISHYTHKDYTMESALLNLVDDKSQKDKHCLNAFAQFTESRADIVAMLKDKKYATAGIHFFNELIARYGNEPCHSHPLSSDRLKIAQEITAMHTAQEQNKVQTA
ncbi:MAG: hypothetical protein AB7F19_01880 [Candidatus Babeliales bacterium]